ncbi:MAG: 50S ribosomal protein L5 [Patescibacteria group bacterium]
MATLQEKYRKEVIPAIQKQFGYKNAMAVPRIAKVVVNSGVGRLRDEKQMSIVRHALALITGQEPSPRPARQAIAAFKTRRGLIIGYRVTLRGRRMWDFLGRLVNVAIPRQRDFQGLEPKSFDARGNLTIGFREHIVFPEMIGEDVPFIFGLEVTVVTTAHNREEGIVLLKLLGFPIKS